MTDSTAYLPPELIESRGIEVISLYINHADGSTERESEITDVSAFWHELSNAGQLPTTSQPSVGDFATCFQKLAAEGRDIISIHISSGISGTIESASQAASQVSEAHPERSITVIDSSTACGGIAMAVMAASDVAARGGSVDDAVAAARSAIDRARIWFAVDTLEYLRRGGRIGGAQAWIGGALKIKPILTCKGTIEPIERVRTSGRAFDRMVAFAKELSDADAELWVVQHIQAPDQADRLVAAASEVFGFPPLYVSEIGPVIGTHVGPGLLGIGGLPTTTASPAATH